MFGVIVGDIVGSRFELNNHRSRNFELFTPQCRPTDDTIMTLAVAQALLSCAGDYKDLSNSVVSWLRELGRLYPHVGYGQNFFRWLMAEKPQPAYGSFGNGAAMRISPCISAARSLEEALDLASAVTCVTHNHPEGMQGAEAVITVMWLAGEGRSNDEIRRAVRDSYLPDFTLDNIRPLYTFDATCRGSVPQAIEAFFEADSFEGALRNAVSIGGDSDTLAAIAGGMAEMRYGVSDRIREQALSFLDVRLRDIIERFEQTFPLSHAGCFSG